MIVLVRHGTTEQNVRGLLLGRADPSLSADGVEQARILAALLEREGRPTRVVTSPLRRCRETAEVIAALASSAKKAMEAAINRMP